MKKIIILIAVAILAIGVFYVLVSNNEEEPNVDVVSQLAPIYAYEWNLERIDVSGTPEVPVNVEDFVISFNADGRIAVQTDCNTMNATYTIEGNSLVLGSIVSTKMACAGETFEQEFATLLSMVTSYSIAEREDGEGLLLGLGISEGSMTFSAGEINIPVYNPNEVEPTIDLDDFVGMTESAAITYAAENDVEFRIGSVDGEAQAVTADYRIGRVTADIVDGVVTGFSVE